MRIARIATEPDPGQSSSSSDRWAEIVDPFAAQPGSPESPTRSRRHVCSPRSNHWWCWDGAQRAPGDRDIPRQAFIKSPRTVDRTRRDITVDDDLGQVNIEGELTVVIRRPSRHLTAEQVPGAILGYTIGNDVTAVDQIALDEKMTQSKNGDGFTPIGPWIETDLDSGSVPMTVSVNGDVVARGQHQLNWPGTSPSSWSISPATSRLGPGDIVLTGAPGTFTPVKPGDNGADLARRNRHPDEPRPHPMSAPVDHLPDDLAESTSTTDVRAFRPDRPHRADHRIEPGYRPGHRRRAGRGRRPDRAQRGQQARLERTRSTRWPSGSARHGRSQAFDVTDPGPGARRCRCHRDRRRPDRDPGQQRRVCSIGSRCST